MRILARCVALVISLAGVSACQLAPYGASAPYHMLSEAGVAVTMPAGAPSIASQFQNPSSESLTATTVGEHLGLDVYEAVGAPVLAAAEGRVIMSRHEPMYGNQVIIQHGLDVTGRPLRTVYKHLQSRSVSKGDKVNRGQQIGGLGTTGVLSQGPAHLHFELWRRAGDGVSRAVDPQFYWVKGVGQVTCFKAGKPMAATPVKLTFPVRCLARP